MALDIRLGEEVIENLLTKDVQSITERFKSSFEDCVSNVQKPNVLVAGVTGAGKSSLVNAVFGTSMALVGAGQPVTKHFMRFEPEEKPVIVYDSKGLEDGRHEDFLKDTQEFFETTRQFPDIGDHIHIIWYVVNAAWARFQEFEAKLVEEVFAPTPVLFVLNKTDIASNEQMSGLEETISQYNFSNSKGILRVVADRKNYSQSWCSKCHSDNIMYKRLTKQLFCDDCDTVEELKETYGLGELITNTAVSLPDLAKEAFLFSQEASFLEKDRRAQQIVKDYSSSVRIDIAGRGLQHVGEMVGRIFILWGWNVLGCKVSNKLVKEMREEFQQQDLAVRIAMVAADTLNRRKLSRSVIACLGVTVNKPLRSLYKQLLSMISAEEESISLPSLGRVSSAAASASSSDAPCSPSTTTPSTTTPSSSSSSSSTTTPTAATVSPPPSPTPSEQSAPTTAASPSMALNVTTDSPSDVTLPHPQIETNDEFVDTFLTTALDKGIVDAIELNWGE